LAANNYLRWLTGNTDSVYWNDSASLHELDAAIANGAVGATTNPFLINNAVRNCPEDWAIPENLDKELNGDDKAEALTRLVTSAIAGILNKFSGKPGGGFCCAQVNPNKPGDEKVMLEQACRYAAIADGIVVKVPATYTGLKVYEECASRGFNVAATVSFTVPQVLAAGAAFERGRKKAEANGIEPGIGVAVLMTGRLDDYLRDVARDSGSAATEEDIRQSGLAAIKRAYGIFEERGYKCKLMPAAGRGPYHVTELAGADMIMSIAPKIAETLEDLCEPFESRINKPIPADVIKRLSDMPEFIKAYEPDGMSAEEFITYGATNRTLAQFCLTGWDKLKTMA